MSVQTERQRCVGSCRVAEAAKDLLRRSPYMAVRTVSCGYSRGRLFLRGQLPSYYHKQLAQETVARLAGVVQVINETEVIASGA